MVLHPIYQAATDKVGLSGLVEEMTSVRGVLMGEMTVLRHASIPSEAIARSERFALLFSEHVEGENGLILPRLLSAQDVDLGAVPGGMYDLFEVAKEFADSAAPDRTAAVTCFFYCSSTPSKYCQAPVKKITAPVELRQLWPPLNP